MLRLAAPWVGLRETHRLNSLGDGVRDAVPKWLSRVRCYGAAMICIRCFRKLVDSLKLILVPVRPVGRTAYRVPCRSVLHLNRP
jgi:hypothetical protein